MKKEIKDPIVKVLNREIKPQISSDHLHYYNQHLLGEMLTIVDAVVVDKVQNKATKDIVKNSFNKNYLKARNWCIDQDDNTRSSFPFRIPEQVIVF